jgi:preprotein translocase subunit SecA
MNMMRDLVEHIVEPIVLESKYPEEWDFETLNRNLRRLTREYEGQTEYSTEELMSMTADSLKEDIIAEFEAIYEKKEEEIGAERMREVERAILLRVVDNLWMDQIDAMDQLKEGIGLRAIGQQDPVAGVMAQIGRKLVHPWLVVGVRKTSVKIVHGKHIKAHQAALRGRSLPGSTARQKQNQNQ